MLRIQLWLRDSAPHAPRRAVPESRKKEHYATPHSQVGLGRGNRAGGGVATLATPSAFADYAPSKGDVVGVGSDTLQYMVDFLADGDAYGDTGYNQLGNKNKLVSFDATADANARLAYGVNGGQASQTVCTPGTGDLRARRTRRPPTPGCPAC